METTSIFQGAIVGRTLIWDAESGVLCLLRLTSSVGVGSAAAAAPRSSGTDAMAAFALVLCSVWTVVGSPTRQGRRRQQTQFYC
jgi:hypothetical protein